MSFLFIPILIFLPGYLITLSFSWVRGFFERIAFSLVTSISVGVVVATMSALSNFPIRISFLLFFLFFVICLICVFRKKIFVIIYEWRELTQKEKWFFVLFICISLTVSVFIAIPHFHYPWPIHADEWWQVGVSQNLIEGKGLNTHPYFFNEFTNDKPGFSSYVAALFASGNIDPVIAWPYMPAVNIFLISFVGALLLYGKTKKILVGILFSFFLVALRSNAYVLGWWFFVPSIQSLFFIIAIVLSMQSWKKSFSGYMWAGGVFIACALVYFPFALFFLIATIPFFLREAKRFRILILLFVFLLGILLIYLAGVVSPYRDYWRLTSAATIPFSTSPIVQSLFVPLSSTFHFAPGSGIFSTVPILLIVFALLSLFLIRKNELILFAWCGALFSFINILLGAWWGASFLLFYQRTFYLFGIFYVVLASYGAGVLDEQFGAWWKKNGLHNVGKHIIYIFFFSGIFLILFNRYFILPPNTNMYFIVNDEDVRAIAWLAHQPSYKNATVIANPVVGTIITPLARIRSKVSLLSSQSINALLNPEEILIEEERDCKKKETLIIRLHGDVVYSKRPQECSFLKEVYTSQNVFIYEYKNTGDRI